MCCRAVPRKIVSKPPYNTCKGCSSPGQDLAPWKACERSSHIIQQSVCAPCHTAPAVYQSHKEAAALPECLFQGPCQRSKRPACSLLICNQELHKFLHVRQQVFLHHKTTHLTLHLVHSMRMRLDRHSHAHNLVVPHCSEEQ